MKLLSLFSLSILLFVVSTSAQEKHEAMKPINITEISVEVEGGKTVKMKAADLAKLTRKEIKAKDHDGVESMFSGYELRDIIAPAGAKLGKDLKGPMIAQYLIVEAADGYHAVYSLTELDPDFTDKVVILGDKRDGKPLENWQIIATNEKKHARWVRQVTALKVRLAH